MEITAMKRTRLPMGLMMAALMAPTWAQDYQIETLASGLEHPWSIAWLPDGRGLVTERPGRLRILEGDRLLPEPIAGVPDVHAASQGGLFEALPGPRYAQTGWIYLSYAHGTADDNATRVARARLEGRTLVELEVLFTARPDKDTPVHYGGRMAFLPDGTLLVGLGDGFDYREAAQQLDSHLGSIVRITTDGEAPPDNPFVDREEALPEIYSYGHRNVQGLAVDPATGAIWQHEHGPRGGDELNRIEAGANYGWPVATHGVNYSGALVSPFESRPGMVDPLIVWTPSIAPAGLALYNGDAFPQWRGDLLVTGLVSADVRRLTITNGRVVEQGSLFGEVGERLRDVRSGPDGFIYLLTDAANGRVLRVRPAGD
jgi:glucose/arabinose dehydrogenase